MISAADCLTVWLRLFTDFNCSANFNYWVVFNFGTLTKNFETSSDCWDSDNWQFAAVVGLTELSVCTTYPVYLGDWLIWSNTASTIELTVHPPPELLKPLRQYTSHYGLIGYITYKLQFNSIPIRYCNCVFLPNFTSTTSSIQTYTSIPNFEQRIIGIIHVRWIVCLD